MLRGLLLRIDEILGRRKPLLFKQDDFNTRELYEKDYEHVANSLIRHISFNTAYDVGCANGFILSHFLSTGKSVRGIELSAAVTGVLPEEIRGVVDIGDFSEAEGKWDLVCCIEVAEHVAPSKSVPLVQKLTELAHDFIYFTAAPPGQSGVGHINCRPHKDWIKWFEHADWTLDPMRTRAVREDLSSLTKAYWLRNNSLVFKSAR